VATVLIGLGDDARGDDGAGLEVARRAGGIAHVGDLSSLLGCWEPGDEVVIVDAVASPGPPGSVLELGPGDLVGAPALSTHDLALPDVLELAHVLGRAPAGVRILGIVGRRFEAGSAMSAEVAAAVDRVARSLTPGA